MMDLLEAAQATGGTATVSGHRFSGVSTDSRAIASGELFVALKGERFDGHAFVPEVLARGAAAALVARDWNPAAAGLPLLRVDDTRLALGQLAAHWRQQFALPVIGITGSNGKTTVKEMCAAILREHERREQRDPAQTVLATRGNLNNEIGVPLMLLGLGAGHRAAVLEMGMNHPGEIAVLTRIVRPSVAVVNNAQRAHLAGLGTLEAVAQAKGEIFAGLERDGCAVINADDRHVALWREMAAGRRILDFGIDQPAEVRAEVELLAFGSRLRLVAGGSRVEFVLPVPGRHNAGNALAAASACLALGVSLETVADALGAYAGVKGRLQRRPGLGRSMLIDDSYNANPDSMRAALDVLAALPGRRIFVMGDMGEVGADAAAVHREVGEYARARRIEALFALGERSAEAAYGFGADARHCSDLGQLLDLLRPRLAEDVTVLIKGSRFMRMERVADALAEKMVENADVA